MTTPKPPSDYDMALPRPLVAGVQTPKPKTVEAGIESLNCKHPLTASKPKDMQQLAKLGRVGSGSI